MFFCLDKRCFVGLVQSPQKPALISDREVTSWQQLKSRVELFCMKLRPKTLQGQPLVIYGLQQHQFVVAMLAALVLKVPFVAVDASRPKTELDQTLNFLGHGVLLDLQTKPGRLQPFSLSEQTRSQDTRYPIAFWRLDFAETGQLQAHSVTQADLSAYFCELKVKTDIADTSVMHCGTSLADPASLTSVFSALTVGSKLLLAMTGRRTTVPALTTFLKKNQVSDLFLNEKIAGEYLADNDFNQSALSGVNNIFLSSLLFDSTLLSMLESRFPDASLCQPVAKLEIGMVEKILESVDEQAALPVTS